MRLHIVLSALTILGTVLVGVPASAETVISNQINVSANTGGATATDGQVIQGESRSQVVIKTEINGEVVVDESWTATSVGSPVVIDELITIESSTYQVKANVEVSVNNASSTESATTSVITSERVQRIVERIWNAITNIFTRYVDQFWSE